MLRAIALVSQIVGQTPCQLSQLLRKLRAYRPEYTHCTSPCNYHLMHTYATLLAVWLIVACQMLFFGCHERSRTMASLQIRVQKSFKSLYPPRSKRQVTKICNDSSRSGLAGWCLPQHAIQQMWCAHDYGSCKLADISNHISFRSRELCMPSFPFKEQYCFWASTALLKTVNVKVLLNKTMVFSIIHFRMDIPNRTLVDLFKLSATLSLWQCDRHNWRTSWTAHYSVPHELIPRVDLHQLKTSLTFINSEAAASVTNTAG